MFKIILEEKDTLRVTPLSAMFERQLVCNLQDPPFGFQQGQTLQLKRNRSL